MAIYNQYGRFIKAKLFKEMLESSGDTYMVFGIGDSFWDDPNSGQPIPVAPYNTTCMSESSGQFLDQNANQYFIDPNAEGDNPHMIQTVGGGTPLPYTFIERCKNLIPPFPCIWKYGEADSDDDKHLIYIGDGEPAYVTQSKYEQYYIKSDGRLYKYDESDDLGAIDLSDSNQPEWAAQYYSELRLRGYAIENFGSGYKTPVGLLGAVKCSISYVKDIGNDYTGNANQFWYGDRYWEIVDPQESDLDNYINNPDETGGKVGQDVYPHYLLITATVNPRQLCSDLNIDQKIIPRQIAIYTRKHDGNPDSRLDGKISFSVADYKFNFGQMSESDVDSDTLNFTFPCNVNGVQYPDGDFKFVLSDYVRGTNRNLHSVSRFGYVIGF
jgi:hypothetical protein